MGGPGVDGREEWPPGGEDRVGLRRHAHSGEAVPQRNDVQVTVARKSRVVRWHEAAEPDVGEARGAGFEIAAPLLLLTRNVTCGKLPGGGDDQLERLREEPDVAGESTTAWRQSPLLTNVGHPIGGLDLRGVDEVGDHALVVLRVWKLGADISGQNRRTAR